MISFPHPSANAGRALGLAGAAPTLFRRTAFPEVALAAASHA